MYMCVRDYIFPDYLHHLNIEVMDKITHSPRKRKFSVSTSKNSCPCIC